MNRYLVISPTQFAVNMDFLLLDLERLLAQWRDGKLILQKQQQDWCSGHYENLRTIRQQLTSVEEMKKLNLELKTWQALLKPSKQLQDLGSALQKEIIDIYHLARHYRELLQTVHYLNGGSIFLCVCWEQLFIWNSD